MSMLIRRNLISVLAVVAALLVLAPSAGAEESVETGVNRPGRDYKDFAMEPSIGGFNSCQAACRNDPSQSCRAWTFVAPGVQGPKAHCYLKKSVPDPVKDKCCVSGVYGVITGIEFDSNRPGNDYRDFNYSNIQIIVRDQPELACKAACEKDGSKCKAWTYVKPAKEGADGHCWLKSAVPALQKNICCISGVSATPGGGGGQLSAAEVADRNPTGKTVEQCVAAHNRNLSRCIARGTIAAACEGEFGQIQSICLGQAAQAKAGGGSTSGGGAPAEWTATLSGHNAKRALHGTPPLAWSGSLAADAQNWANANACSPKHSDFNGFGENLYYGSSATGKDAVDWWYAEIKQYDWNNPIGSYNANADNRNPSKEVRHFTQVVWRATTTLGCGIAQCGDQKFVVCRYKPPGNFNANNPGVLEANVPRN